MRLLLLLSLALFLLAGTTCALDVVKPISPKTASTGTPFAITLDPTAVFGDVRAGVTEVDGLPAWLQQDRDFTFLGGPATSFSGVTCGVVVVPTSDNSTYVYTATSGDPHFSISLLASVEVFRLDDNLVPPHLTDVGSVTVGGYGDRACICTAGGGLLFVTLSSDSVTLKVLTTGANPASPSVVGSLAIDAGWPSLAVDTVTYDVRGYVYAVGSRSDGKTGNLLSIDVRNPRAPTLLDSRVALTSLRDATRAGLATSSLDAGHAVTD